jgi:NCS1 nucleoside transporter family
LPTHTYLPFRGRAIEKYVELIHEFIYEEENNYMATDTVAIPEEHGIETHGIERVSPETRTHVRILDNFTMWMSANLVLSTIAVGALASVLGLGFWDSFIAIVLFNALGVLPVAFFSTLGPRLGLRQMTISRFSFGWVGAIIMALFNVAACIGWSTVNVIIGGQLVNALSNGVIPSWGGVLIIAVLTTLVSIYGYRYVHRYERYAWIPLAIIFVIMFAISVQHFKIVPATTTLSLAGLTSFITLGGAVYGFATGWSSYAADYNVNQPENTPVSRVFWLTFLGVFIPCVVLETLGLLFTSVASWGKDFADKGSGALLSDVVHPLGGFGTFILALLALSVIANNIPNDYSLGLSVQVFGRWWQRVPRYVWTLIGAVIYVAIALPNSSNFATTLQNFLFIIAYWLGPWAIILVLEHFVFRHGRYNIDDWNTPGRLPIGWAAIVSMAIGLVGVALGAAQVYYVGPIAHALGGQYGMDVGFELGVIFAGISYLILRNIEIRTSRRGELEASNL